MLCLALVHRGDARHHGRAVGQRQTVAQAQRQGRQALGRQSLGGRHLLSAVPHAALADHRQGDVGQLHQVAAGTHAAMTRHDGRDMAVNHVAEHTHHVGVHARMALNEGAQTRHHGGTYHHGIDGVAHARGVTAHNMILQVGQSVVAHAPLCHRPEARVDAVDDLVFCKCTEEAVGPFHAGHLVVSQRQRLTVVEYGSHAR